MIIYKDEINCNQYHINRLNREERKNKIRKFNL